MSRHSERMSETALRQAIVDAIPHFDHILPAQAPIKDFVHHNTLHGYQQLPFPQALQRSRARTGARGYEEEGRYREYFRKGRITLADLEYALQQSGRNDEALAIDTPLFTLNGETISRKEVMLQALIQPLRSLSACQLAWQIEEQNALEQFQPDVGEEARHTLLLKHNLDEKGAISTLWSAILEKMSLHHLAVHPESLLDLSPEHAQRLVNQQQGEEGSEESHQLTQKESIHHYDALVERVGRDLTLRGLIRILSGRDILNNIRPLLIQQIANYLDQGMSAWHSTQRHLGFYPVWRQSATLDSGWIFDDLPEWMDELEILPDDPLDTIIVELRRLGLRPSRWVHYLEQLALEIPGWSGMFLWRHLNPGYEGLTPNRVEMVDYLAVRLVMERLFAQRVCREEWQLEANLDVLRWYFHRRSSDFYVRYHLFNNKLPEYLVTHAQALVEQAPPSHEAYEEWKRLADTIWTWKQSANSDQEEGFSVYRSGWRIFRLAQHMGISGAEIEAMEPTQLEAICHTIALLDEQRSGWIWLQAYEHHYREQFFNAVADNHQRGAWAERSLQKGQSERPSAQLVFCMDDREEGFRRHLEEINPTIETLGAAAHFGVPHFWQGIDDHKAVGLTPVVLTPSHEIREQVQPCCSAEHQQHKARLQLRQQVEEWFHQGTRRNLASAAAGIVLAAPATLAVLAGKVFQPRVTHQLLQRFSRWTDRGGAPTSITLTAAQAAESPTPDNRQIGFTDREQLERVLPFLQNIGLLHGFAPIVVIVGHGSSSQNNPHLAAYDCGACSGRHSGPNARIFAAIMNRPEIRARLAEQGVEVPEECWFLGAEHNTCDESITWYDLDQLPKSHQPPFEQLQQALAETQQRHAQERCRRLASAPKLPQPTLALHHIQGRAVDFSQARPELGHATNAAAIIGRRSLSRGTFFDRRVFLISYDYQTDPEGTVLERLLLANGPVGAGISLEYYFSTVDNEGYGSGSKITHNVSGLFGVMDGASSDLRTGLPKQMVEIHEAMRLQVMVEARIDTITKIYQRQPALQELIGNGWILVSAKDPESETIHAFDPAAGWVKWEGARSPLPVVRQSNEWFMGHSAPLAPSRIEQGDRT
jgi:uncharacterized protein YbcC (UPF0753/DUF2309 family)